MNSKEKRTVSSLRTPSIIVDLDILEKNITTYQKLCDAHGKKLWPMVKTHKSTEIAAMQQAAGADGFLCGTLDECEALANRGIRNIMYAYPVASEPSLSRVMALSQKCNMIVRIDCLQSAMLISEKFARHNAILNCCVIIDSGLHRFGIEPQQAAEFVKQLQGLKGIKVVGIATHPGHVYGVQTKQDVKKCAQDEMLALKAAGDILQQAGYKVGAISSGSTPTFKEALKSDLIGIYHPGNYVFNDVIQMSLGAVEEEDCSLSILATVISVREGNTYLIDAGSKCFGLDQGAHGNTAITGFGVVKGHPELVVSSLSEEVGKLTAMSKSDIKVGQKVQIIPNHACVPANMTSFLWGYRGGDIEKCIAVDIRGNSTAT